MRFTKIGECHIDPTARILGGSIIGKPFRRLLDGSEEEGGNTTICRNTYIGYYCLIGSSVVIGENSIIDDRTTVESRVSIGKSNLIIYGAHICNEVTVGDSCIIGGFVGERTEVGDRCRIFGKIVHSQYDPSLGWDDDDSMEPAAIIQDSVFIGAGAIVAGGVTIGSRAYVCSGAIVTKNVPGYHVVRGFNQHVHYSKLISPLKMARFFSRDTK